MNESQWQSCRRADHMLQWLIEPGTPIRTRWQGPMPTSLSRTSERKLRLFACACGRILERQLRPGPLCYSDYIEQWIEGQLATPDMVQKLEPLRNGGSIGYVVFLQTRIDWRQPNALIHLRETIGLYHGFEADLLREIVGNPFQTFCLSPAERAWNEGTLGRIAQEIAQTKRWEELPILGDALEEAGCHHEEALQHCRSGHIHAPGCWVLDACLGRE
jgi:hypothetical protein